MATVQAANNGIPSKFSGEGVGKIAEWGKQVGENVGNLFDFMLEVELSKFNKDFKTN